MWCALARFTVLAHVSGLNVSDKLPGPRLSKASDWVSMYNFSSSRELAAEGGKTFLGQTQTTSILRAIATVRAVTVPKSFRDLTTCKYYLNT